MHVDDDENVLGAPASTDIVSFLARSQPTPLAASAAEVINAGLAATRSACFLDMIPILPMRSWTKSPAVGPGDPESKATADRLEPPARFENHASRHHRGGKLGAALCQFRRQAAASLSQNDLWDFPDASPIRGCQLKNFAHAGSSSPNSAGSSARGKPRGAAKTSLHAYSQGDAMAPRLLFHDARIHRGLAPRASLRLRVARGAWSGLPAKRVNWLSGPDRRKGSRPGAARFHLRMSNASSSTSRARFVSTMQPRFSS